MFVKIAESEFEMNCQNIPKAKITGEAKIKRSGNLLYDAKLFENLQK